MELRRTIANASEELEVLIRRAARVGELDVGELIDAYVRLQPSGHTHLGNPRKVSLDTLSETLKRLPVVFTEVDEVRLVTDLDGFDVQPIPGAGWRAGLMSDGALLLELAHGTNSLLGFAATVCALAVEWTKIEHLLGEREEFAPESPEEALAAAGIDPSEEEPTAEPIADLAEIAFELGVEEHDLVNASARCRGVLFELLDRPLTFPRIRVHADLATEEADGRGRRLGRALGEAIVELGFKDQPVHLWVGHDVVTDCLSPYARELREPLVTWARRNPDAVGADLHQLQSLLDESTVYAIMRDFFRADSRVLDERRVADATVGIQRHRIGELNFEVLDLQRIEAALIDARILEWELDEASVLLRVDRPDNVDERAFMDELLEAFGASLVSITTLLHGTLLQPSSPSAVILPHLLLRWSGEHKLSLPGARALEADHFMGLAEPQSGAVLSMPSASLLNAAHVESLAESFRVAGIEVGGDGIVCALHDALWTGVLNPDVAISWPLIDHSRTHGRSSVHALTAASSVAIALLRRIGAAPPPEEPAPPPPEPKRGPSRTAVRIRA
ncbi:MAG: hypothetical protein AAFX94_00520 [Myxococcota bacterium]